MGIVSCKSCECQKEIDYSFFNSSIDSNTEESKPNIFTTSYSMNSPTNNSNVPDQVNGEIDKRGKFEVAKSLPNKSNGLNQEIWKELIKKAVDEELNGEAKKEGKLINFNAGKKVMSLKEAVLTKDCLFCFKKIH